MGATVLESKELCKTYIVDKYSNNVLQNVDFKLEEGEYFVLGDNRNNSEDSRNAEIGIVSSEMIEGEVWFVLSPAEHRGFL